jgi:hypothetical protein
VVRHEADVVCGLLREFDSLDSCHSKAEKAITTARAVADTLRSDIAAALKAAGLSPTGLGSVGWASRIVRLAH